MSMQIIELFVEKCSLIDGFKNDREIEVAWFWVSEVGYLYSAR